MDLDFSQAVYDLQQKTSLIERGLAAEIVAREALDRLLHQRFESEDKALKLAVEAHVGKVKTWVGAATIIAGFLGAVAGRFWK